MNLESRIAALTTALAEKHAANGGMGYDHTARAYYAGASALVEVFLLRGKLEGLHWAEINTKLSLDAFKDLLHEQKHVEAQLEALLKQMEKV